MRLKNIQLGKEFKCGLPNYSNLTLTCNLTFELGEQEEPDWNSMWDTINHQLYIQSSGIDASWIQSKEYRNFFKIAVRQSKVSNGSQQTEE